MLHYRASERWWKRPDNEFTAKQKVTLAHRLSHTAGLTVHGFPGKELAKLDYQKSLTLKPHNTCAVEVLKN